MLNSRTVRSGLGSVDTPTACLLGPEHQLKWVAPECCDGSSSPSHALHLHASMRTLDRLLAAEARDALLAKNYAALADLMRENFKVKPLAPEPAQLVHPVQAMERRTPPPVAAYPGRGMREASIPARPQGALTTALLPPPPRHTASTNHLRRCVPRCRQHPHGGDCSLARCCRQVFGIWWSNRGHERWRRARETPRGTICCRGFRIHPAHAS